jgi:hypothetical protein
MTQHNEKWFIRNVNSFKLNGSPEITANALENVWEELQYRVDVCSVTLGA